MPPTSFRSMDGDRAVADICQPELLSEAQIALAILADIDCRYETLSHRLEVQSGQRSAGPAVIKESLHRR